MLHRGTVPDTLYLSGETSDNDCEMGACCGEEDELCLCATAPCPLYPEAHCTQMSVKIQCCRSLEPSAASPIVTQEETLTCEHHGKDRLVITRYSEGYGTESVPLMAPTRMTPGRSHAVRMDYTEECVLSDPQGESDADADIEDTDCRLHEAGSLQRISSRRRKRPRVARQDTTESEDDGGRSHRTHRWNLRLSPHPAQSKTILEESVSQVRPLVICRPSAADGVRTSSDNSPRSPRCRLSRWPSSPPLPLALLILLFLLLLFALVIFVTS